MRPIGWYVHHQGAGHVTRFLAVRPHLDAEVHAFSTRPAPDPLPARTTWTVLPPDDDSTAGDEVIAPRAHGALHWAPLGHRGHRQRMGTIAGLCASGAVSAFVVDVSVEVTLLVRVMGTPVIVFSQPGDRTDAPHAWAYRAADRIIAPWPRDLLASAALDDVADRVRWVGGVSRFAGRRRSVAAQPGTVLALGSIAGADGDDGDPVVTSRLDATPAHWVADPWDALCRHEVIVTAAGQNSVADIAAAGARAIVIPQQRPFDEQEATGRALRDAGLAVVLHRWPSRAQWPEVAERARGIHPDWDRWQVRGAPQRAAAAIAEVAR